MCRIAGIIDNRLQPELLKEKVKAMCQSLRHGGPDDEGIHVDEKMHLVFGHRRLSIIDLSKNGHQPMADVSQKAWITFNGEIYNYQEIKNELLKEGAQFNSASDTEVIILAYLQWGTSAFAKFRGIFAFALFDRLKGLTYLVRDLAGVKPVYYFIDNGGLSFASETRAFEASGITTEKDPNWPARFLAFGHIPEPYTTLKNVFSLPNGHYLCWDHGSSTYVINTYKQQVVKDQIIDNNEAKHLIKEALSNAVKRQMISDAPLGVFLSGGIDSSLLTLLADREKKHQLNTVSIFFNEKAYNEQEYQRVILNKISGQNFSHLVKQQDFETHFPEIIKAMDMPTTDGINTWFISKYAHENGLKAVLSGVGADEYFGGYPSFNRIKALGDLRRLGYVGYLASKCLVDDKYKKLAFLKYNHQTADYLLLRGLFAPRDIARILDTDIESVESTLFGEDSLPPIKKYDELMASWFEINIYMQNQLLRDTDVMSMNHGLEVRLPFLDEDFIQIAESIPKELRFNKLQPKKLLIDSFDELLPQKIWDRPKMGFSFPLQHWMKLHPQISNEHFYRGKLSKSLVQNFKQDKLHWSKVFALYQIQLHV